LLETNGSLTVLPRAEKRPVTLEDLKLNALPESLPLLLILDGQIEENNLASAGFTRQWLLEELKKRGVTDPHTVLIAMLDTRGRFYFQTKPTGKREKLG